MNQEQVWDKIAEPWSKYRKNPPKEILDFLKDKEGKILDLGCGSGRNFIKQENLEYYGVDFSEEMLRLGQRTATKEKIKVKLQKADLTNLPFENDFFDACLFISALHCIEKEESRKKAIEELYRVLKKGAEAIISVWDRNSNFLIEKIDAKEIFVNWKKDEINYQRCYHLYDRQELIDSLKEVGFSIIDMKITGDEKHSKKNIVLIVKK